MADRYFQIQSFSHGLDTRRSELTEIPGTLVSCVNAHINSGGEIVQRKSFAKQAGQYTGPVFGLEVTKSGLVAFALADIFSQPITVPTGVLVAKFVPPSPINSNGTQLSLTGVTFSCNFNGDAFILAKFSDGNTYAYYGDYPTMTLVGQINRGKVVYYHASPAAPEANYDLVGDLAAFLNTIDGFDVTTLVDENGTVNLSSLILKTQPGIHVSFDVNLTSAAGALTAQLIDQNVDGTVDQPSIAPFYISAGVGGGVIQISAPPDSTGVGTVDLTGGNIAWGGSTTTTATLVVNAINSRTGITGYIAKLGTGVNTDKIYVYAPTEWGALANGFNLAVTTTNITVATAVAPQSLTVFPNPASEQVYRGAQFHTFVVTAVPSGFTGTPTYTWTVKTSSVNYVINQTSNNTSCTFLLFSTGAATIHLKAVDTGGTGNTKDIDFQLTTTLK